MTFGFECWHCGDGSALIRGEECAYCTRTAEFEYDSNAADEHDDFEPVGSYE